MFVSIKYIIDTYFIKLIGNPGHHHTNYHSCKLLAMPQFSTKQLFFFCMRPGESELGLELCITEEFVSLPPLVIANFQLFLSG